MPLAALIVEAGIGYPRRWWHPVMGVGALIAGFERRWNRRRRLEGVILVLLLVALSIVLGRVIERMGTIVTVLAATTGLAQRSLHDHVAAVARPLAAGDLSAARAAVAMIVGRDTDTLDEAGVATAAIESLAESFCDGVVAPALGLLLFGLPGLFAVKAINTADSMVGHRTPELCAFGWASARADDIVNFVPARIAGALIALAGRGGWREMRRDAPAHASPNGGWPEAAMAGALGRRLGGAVTYDGEPAQRAILGDGPRPDARDLARALVIYRTACLLLWMLVGLFPWLG
ncbi:adenosylcobinamide-phosphate synthase CbiB [uncultured Sphingomonas sp.]|uniref:adenosylcobinamide-phosphate synthase CbiB n=1 Tax=uncultured Sphingomonas sp. TaxID=158754 RepID=UPI00258E61A5|nr:adenosylcobinamide-phosphate synthase CbiB [uncultured Sphingomonas sp.]